VRSELAVMICILEINYYTGTFCELVSQCESEYEQSRCRFHSGKSSILPYPGDDEATCTWDDEELDPGVRKKKKKKLRTPGKCCHL